MQLNSSKTPVTNQQHWIRLKLKDHDLADFREGSVVAFTLNKDSLRYGFVVKKTAVKMTILHGFRSYQANYPTPHWKEYFEAISRYPSECTIITPDEVDDLQELETLLGYYNKAKNTNIELNFKL